VGGFVEEELHVGGTDISVRSRSAGFIDRMGADGYRPTSV
jgi:hypothetical protein